MYISRPTVPTTSTTTTSTTSTSTSTIGSEVTTAPVTIQPPPPPPPPPPVLPVVAPDKYAVPVKNQVDLTGRGRVQATSPKREPTEEVMDVVDSVIGDDATAEQIDEAYQRVQQRFDELRKPRFPGQAGDDLPVREGWSHAVQAAKVLEELHIPTVASSDVLSAVDSRISSKATRTQQRRAYELAAEYVENSPRGVPPKNFESEIGALLRQNNIPTLATTGAESVLQAARTGSPVDVAHALSIATRALPPDEVDALLASIQPTLTAAAARVNFNPFDKDTVDAFYGDLLQVSDVAGKRGNDILASTLVPSFPALFTGSVDEAIAAGLTAGHGLALGSALTAGLDKAGKSIALNHVNQALVESVNSAREDADVAQEKYKEYQTRLTADLAEFGPALTPEERQAYIDAFWNQPDAHDVKLDASTTSRDLALALQQGGVEALARRGDEQAAEALMDGYATLAGSPEHADLVLDFVKRVGKDATLNAQLESTIGEDFSKDLTEKVLVPALESHQAELIGEALEDGSPGAIEQALATFEKTLSAFDVAETALNLPPSITKLADAIRLLREGNVDEAAELAEEISANGDAVSSAFTGILTTFAVIQSGANLIDDPSLEHLLGAAKVGVEATSILLNTLEEAGHVSPAAAKGFAEFAGKFGPAISLVLDGKQFKDEFQALQDEGNVGDVVKLFGTSVNLVGDVFDLVPVAGTAVDVAITVVGTTIHAIGSFIDFAINARKDEAELDGAHRDLLSAAGIEDPLREQLVQYGGLFGQIGTLGLTVDQVRDLANTILNDDENHQNADFLALKMGAAHGLTGAELLEFVDDVRSSSEQLNYVYPPSELNVNRADVIGQGSSKDNRVLEIREAEQQWLEDFLPDVYGKWNERLDAQPTDSFNDAFFTRDPNY